MEVRFHNAWILFLLWVVPLLLTALIVALRSRERRIASFVSPLMQKRLRPKSDLKRRIWQSCLVAAGIFFCLLALARPQWGQSEQKVFRKGRDIVIALDVSRSMLANDVHPNRLKRAKVDILDLLHDLSGDRAALLAFRHKAVALCPLTTDYAFLRYVLDSSGTHSAPVGETDIGAAIDEAIRMLSEDDSAHKAILLISDGEDLKGRAIEAARNAAERGIPVFTVGFGRASGSTIPDSDSGAHLQYKGKDVVSRLDNKTLYEIAKITGGAYVPIQTASTAETTLGSIYKTHFAKIAAKEIEETLTTQYAERFQYFLLPGLLFLIAAAFLSKGSLAAGRHKATHLKNMNPSSAGVKALAIAFAMLLPLTAVSDTNSVPDTASPLPEGRAAARKAQRHFSRGHFDEAADLYLRAARTSEGQAHEDFTFNAAVSLLRSGNNKEAIDLLNTISGEGSIPLDKRDMALGAAHYRSIKSYDTTNQIEKLEYTAESLKRAAEYYAEAARLQTDVSDTALSSAQALARKVPEARKKAKVSALLSEHEKTETFQLLDKMLAEQRKIMDEAADAYVTDNPSQINLLEKLADRQDSNTDLWIPLKQKLDSAAAASTNQLSAQALEKISEDLEQKMKLSASEMRDLDTSGYHDAAISEDGIYHIWKGAAPLDRLLTEDLRRQSNALSSASHPQVRVREQNESVDLTKLFKTRFEKTFPENMPQPQKGDEDAMTPEKRQKIIDLTDDASASQAEAAAALKEGKQDEAAQKQDAAISRMKEIQSLLPKEKKNQNQNQNKQQPQPQNQNKPDKKKEPQKPEKQNQQPADKQQGEHKEPPEKQPEKQDKNESKMSEADVRRLLEKALQREKEHELEKRMRKEYTPSRMIERDW